MEIVKPDELGGGGVFKVNFVGPDGEPFPVLVRDDGQTPIQYADVRGKPEVVFTFMDANGNYWRSSTSGKTPERVKSS